MGVDTQLYIGNRWTLDDIVDTIKSARAEQIEADGNGFKVESCHDTALGMFRFLFEGRMMYVHSHTSTPIGRCTLLSLGCNEHAKKIMKSIAYVLGGLFEDNDVDGKMEFITGNLTDEDGLQYHLKYAVIHDGLDDHDAEGLKESIDRWNIRHS